MNKTIKIIKILLFVLCLSLHLIAYSENTDIDGQSWEKFDGVMKISYVQGLYDGVAFCQAKFYEGTIDNSPMAKQLAMDMYFIDVAKTLDEFYSDDKNNSILVPYALQLIKMQKDGKDPLEIEIHKRRILETTEKIKNKFNCKIINLL